MEIDILWKLLDSIQGQIKNFDTKAQVAIGLDGLLAGLLGAELAKSVDYAVSGMRWRFLVFAILAALSLVAGAISFAFALKTIHPQLHLNQPKSRFFFCHVVERYGKDYRRAAHELGEMSTHDTKTELGTQILTVSIICDAKATRCRRSLLAAGIGLALYLMTIYPFSSMAFEMAKRKG